MLLPQQMLHSGLPMKPTVSPEELFHCSIFTMHCPSGVMPCQQGGNDVVDGGFARVSTSNYLSSPAGCDGSSLTLLHRAGASLCLRSVNLSGEGATYTPYFYVCSSDWILQQKES